MRCEEGNNEISSDEIIPPPALTGINDEDVVVTSAIQINKLLTIMKTMTMI